MLAKTISCDGFELGIGHLRRLEGDFVVSHACCEPKVDPSSNSGTSWSMVGTEDMREWRDAGKLNGGIQFIAGQGDPLSPNSDEWHSPRGSSPPTPARFLLSTRRRTSGLSTGLDEQTRS